jgi:hypothetical protein
VTEVEVLPVVAVPHESEPVPTVAAETVALAEPTVTPEETHLVQPMHQDAVEQQPVETTDVVRQQRRREKTLHLRIVRDSQRCPVTPCYKWHLIQQRMKSPRPPVLDMTGLRLAPSIREDVEKGKIELIVDAVEQHKSVNGRDTVIMVATGLAGITPHDGQ